MESYRSWNELSDSCPGINTGKINTKSEIEFWLKKKLCENFIRVENGEIIL